MKYILLLLLFCTNAFAGVTLAPARAVKKEPAKGYVVYRPDINLDVYLDTQLSHKCDIPKKFVYVVWLKKHTFYGCWELINNETHIVYESGNTEIYTIKELEQ